EKKTAYGRVDDTMNGDGQISQKNPMYEDNQNHAERQVEKNGMRGQVDEVAAIVEAVDTHARRQDTRCVELLDLLFNTADRRQALLAAPHQHDSLDDVVLLVAAGNSEARLVADDDLGDIAHKNRSAVCRR